MLRTILMLKFLYFDFFQIMNYYIQDCTGNFQGKIKIHYLTVLRIHDISVWIRIWIRGSMPLTNGSGSGSADPCLWIMDPDPDSAIFVIDLQDGNKKKIIVVLKFFCLLLFDSTFTSFFKIKSQKEVTKQYLGIKGFLTIFAWVIEGSGSWSGSIPLTNGSWSGSRMPKNIRIRRIRIRNTALKLFWSYPTARQGRFHLFNNCIKLASKKWPRFTWSPDPLWGFDARLSCWGSAPARLFASQRNLYIKLFGKQ